MIPYIRWRLFAHGIRYYGAVGALLCSPDSAGHSEKPRFNLSEGCIYLARVDRGKAPSYFPSNFIIRFTAVNSQKASHVAASTKTKTLNRLAIGCGSCFLLHGKICIRASAFPVVFFGCLVDGGPDLGLERQIRSETRLRLDDFCVTSFFGILARVTVAQTLIAFAPLSSMLAKALAPAILASAPTSSMLAKALAPAIIA